jgi:hypothetical protein
VRPALVRGLCEPRVLFLRLDQNHRERHTSNQQSDEEGGDPDDFAQFIARSTSLFSQGLPAPPWAPACDPIVLCAKPRCLGAAGRSREWEVSGSTVMIMMRAAVLANCH